MLQGVRGAPAPGPRHQLAQPEHQGATPPGGPFLLLLSGGAGSGELALALKRVGANVGDEPRDDMAEADDARARMTAARQIMRLALEADHPDFAPEQLERGEQLLSFGDRAAEVSIGMEDQ